jgi:hypothetical protein
MREVKLKKGCEERGGKVSLVGYSSEDCPFKEEGSFLPWCISLEIGGTPLPEICPWATVAGGRVICRGDEAPEEARVFDPPNEDN